MFGVFSVMVFMWILAALMIQDEFFLILIVVAIAIMIASR